MTSATAATGASIAWLNLEPLTGRTHQLRVHCESMGFPIVGCTIYGTAPREGGPGGGDAGAVASRAPSGSVLTRVGVSPWFKAAGGPPP
mgnify:CR=1 FL=1